MAKQKKKTGPEVALQGLFSCYSSSVTDNSTSMAVKTMKIVINANTIVNIVLNSYQVINPLEPGGACWIMCVSGMA